MKDEAKTQSGQVTEWDRDSGRRDEHDPLEVSRW
jgi:hypothetical protein